jgi:hypothetical protein
MSFHAASLYLCLEPVSNNAEHHPFRLLSPDVALMSSLCTTLGKMRDILV